MNQSATKAVRHSAIISPRINSGADEKEVGKNKRDALGQVVEDLRHWGPDLVVNALLVLSNYGQDEKYFADLFWRLHAAIRGDTKFLKFSKNLLSGPLGRVGKKPIDDERKALDVLDLMKRENISRNRAAERVAGTMVVPNGPKVASIQRRLRIKSLELQKNNEQFGAN